ncbi:putative nuclease HARBI1 [Aphidius gifuensis]|uniref:putative nuclease HARBI1 n=1 Tax=Aphidius gifuensis TaxID=684658 RepID=UPI001CDC235A|nr:putative nuclease HARBI1 [Aphidius gifuensis]
MFGRQYEEDAIQKLKTAINAHSIVKCGLFIDEIYEMLACTPDGVVEEEDAIVKVKALYRAEPMDVYRNRRRGQRRRDLLHDDQRNEQIPPRTQILITLRFLASGAFYKVIGDFAGISKSTVWSIIHRVIHRIASLRDEYIHFPTTQQEIRQTQADFFVRFGFPRVVGCIDCKHIQIRSFGGPDAELFRNRDNYFSINTQVVCNAHLEITDIVARWPGSSHDSTIFHNSRLMANFEAANYQDGLLLGDAGYPSLPFLMTPVAQPNTPQEVLYNESQIRTRGHIERLFGIWARKWPFISGSRFKHRENTFAAIVALAVLHNIVRQRQLMWIGRVTGDVNEYTRIIHNTFNIQPNQNARQQIIDNYFYRLIHD